MFIVCGSVHICTHVHREVVICRIIWLGNLPDVSAPSEIGTFGKYGTYASVAAGQPHYLPCNLFVYLQYLHA